MASSPIDPDVARARFAVLVDRALRQAHTAGLTDRKIYQLSGVSTSTFHRWRTRQGKEMPQVDKVQAFFRACGASVDDALAALGIGDAVTPKPTPEPPLPQDVRIILRRLADPNVSEAEKQVIRMTLQMLADRAAAPRRNDERSPQEAG